PSRVYCGRPCWEGDMAQLITKLTVRQKLAACGLAITIGWGFAPQNAVAASYCVQDQFPPGGKLSVEDTADITALINGFFDPLAKTGAKAQDRIDWLTRLFPGKFWFEVCAGGGNTQVFLSDNDRSKLEM